MGDERGCRTRTGSGATGADRQYRSSVSLAALIVVALAIGLLPGAAWAGPATGSTPAASHPPGVEPERGIVYREVDGTELRLDARLPTGGAAPTAAIVIVHGGGWSGGRRDAPQWRSLCADLAAAGYAAFSVDYRLAPDDPFPAAFEDVQAAVRWLREPAQVDRFGIDPDRIGILGGSAGGQLAGLVGTAGEGDLTVGARVGAVVSLSGPMVLTEDAIGAVAAPQIESALSYLGCAAIDDCPVAELASPIATVDGTDPAFLLVNATDDHLVPAEQAVTMGDALDAAGVPAEVTIVPGSAHATHLLDDSAIMADVLAFLDEYLAGSPARSASGAPATLAAGIAAVG